MAVARAGEGALEIGAERDVLAAAGARTASQPAGADDLCDAAGAVGHDAHAERAAGAGPLGPD